MVIRLVVKVTINVACMQAASQKIIHACAVPIYSIHLKVPQETAIFNFFYN